MMDLEAIRLHCERMIEWHRGDQKEWTSHQMLALATDLQRIIENQRVDVHLSRQMERLTEENRALLEENLRLMHGRLWTTYRMADGSLVFGEFAWVTDEEFFEDAGEPVEVIKETWRLMTTERVTFKPSWWDDLNEDDDDEPDRPVEDAGSPDHLPE